MLASPILEVISQYMYPMAYGSIESMYNRRPPRTTFLRSTLRLDIVFYTLFEVSLVIVFEVVILLV